MLYACSAYPLNKNKNNTPNDRASVKKIPMVIFLSRITLSNMPIPIPATDVKRSKPNTGSAPTKTAPAAPANPICASAWPAKVNPRISRKYPTIAATIATQVEAKNAFCIKE